MLIRSLQLLLVLVLVVVIVGASSHVVVVDTDLGDDDVAALNLLFGSAKSASSYGAPIAITTVFGVCSMVNATAYALGIEQAFLVPNQSQPFDQSSSSPSSSWPIVPISAGAANFFPGGLFMPFQDESGPISAIPTSVRLRTTQLTAVQSLLQLAQNNHGQLVILAIGPLTNIAQAIIEGGDSFTSAISRIIIMGGAVFVPGNTNNQLAEWNIRADPTAADIVFKSNIASKVLVPMDATAYASCTVQLVAAVTEPPSRTVPGLMIQQSVDRICSTWSDAVLYDPVAAAVLLQPDLVTEMQVLPLKVVLEGVAIGQTAVDPVQGSLMEVVLAIDTNAFITRLRSVTQLQTWWPQQSQQ